MMVHGPCGLADPSAPCMKEGCCSKNFQKRFNNTTYFDKDGYAHYRRRETGVYTTRQGVDLDNSYTDSKTWCPRRRPDQGSIDRLAHVHPNKDELFYLQMLLYHQKGCHSFEDIQTVNKRLYSTFRAACEALGLLVDDKEWDTALMEACFSSTPYELRKPVCPVAYFL
ncbi:hypothetical protein Tco_0104006 [Tanacetum coccineum]